MSKNTIVLTGDKELNRKLALLKSSKAKLAIRKASRIALRPVVDEARANAPKKTGRLKRSIKLRSIKRSRSRVGSRVTSSGTDNNFKGRTFYGGFLEFGWRAGRRVRNADLGVTRRKRRTVDQVAAAAQKNDSRTMIPAREFMKKAARSKRELALSIYRRETRRWIREFSKS